jgi:hypothetical protein
MCYEILSFKQMCAGERDFSSSISTSKMVMAAADEIHRS